MGNNGDQSYFNQDHSPTQRILESNSRQFGDGESCGKCSYFNKQL